MGSVSIDREGHPGLSDAEIAEALAREYGLIAVVRYKNVRNAEEFTNFGLCYNEEEISRYLNTPYDPEVIFPLQRKGGEEEAGSPGALEALGPIAIDPRKYPTMFLGVDRSNAEILVRAFVVKEVGFDYFFYGDAPVEIPGSKALLVTSDRTGSVPRSREPSLTGDKYEEDLSCRLFFVKAKDKGVYCFGEGTGGTLAVSEIDRYLSAALLFLQNEDNG